MKKIVCILVTLLLCVSGFAQDSAEKANRSPQLYVSLGEYGPLMQKLITDNDIATCQYINDGQFLGTEPFTFNPELLIQEINRAVPNPNAGGMVYIDLEGVYLDNLLHKNIEEESFKKV